MDGIKCKVKHLKVGDRFRHGNGECTVSKIEGNQFWVKEGGYYHRSHSFDLFLLERGGLPIKTHGKCFICEVPLEGAVWLENNTAMTKPKWLSACCGSSDCHATQGIYHGHWLIPAEDWLADTKAGDDDEETDEDVKEYYRDKLRRQQGRHG